MGVLSAADLAAVFGPPIGTLATIAGVSSYGRFAEGVQSMPTADPQFEAVVEGTTLLVPAGAFPGAAVDVAVSVADRSFTIREMTKQDDGLTVLLHLAEVTP